MKAFKSFTKVYKQIPKIIVGLMITGGTAYAINSHLKFENYQFNKQTMVSASAATSRLEQILSFNFIADVVETITPSVVSITVSGSIIGISFGSGFIVDESGFILTNAHVVSRNPFVTVTLSNGQKYQGEVIAIDKTSDLALIKIPNSNAKFPSLKFAQLSKVRAGEFVIALGSPMTLSNTVTVGVVSAVERDLGHSKGLKYVQTDAIITVGNSGGPLVNLFGEVVGVNTMMVSTGFGFAIPSDHCHSFVELAMNSKSSGGCGNGYDKSDINKTMVNKPGLDNKYMGVVMGSLTPQMVYENKMNNPEYSVHPHSGVMIHSVFQMSPAHKSGILPGDIIESVNGIIVHSTAELTKAIAQFDNLDFVLVRKGQRLVLKNVIPEIF